YAGYEEPMPDSGFLNGLGAWSFAGNAPVFTNSQTVSTGGTAGSGPTSFTTISSPEAGNYVAIYGTAILMSPVVKVKVGDKFMSVVAFSGEDYPPFNDAFTVGLISVLTGNTLASVTWSIDTIGGAYSLMPWTQFLHTFTGDDELQYFVKIENILDRQLDSWGFSTAGTILRVPEPASLVLIAIGLFSIFVLAGRRRKQK
ncbi:PEP-CTERM sorting domain-containing protein, partial [Candidatus Kaiserbacteria bacterium]|nr:PEP-CTERM sorting domain-containing protein [Candidatus Kaiserbacteria bacterium]